MEGDPCKTCGRIIRNSPFPERATCCNRCALLNLARFMEDTSNPDATLHDISEGEQTGAWLRELANTGRIPRKETL